jgi:hypothetical protein
MGEEEEEEEKKERNEAMNTRPSVYALVGPVGTDAEGENKNKKDR